MVLRRTEGTPMVRFHYLILFVCSRFPSLFCLRVKKLGKLRSKEGIQIFGIPEASKAVTGFGGSGETHKVSFGMSLWVASGTLAAVSLGTKSLGSPPLYSFLSSEPGGNNVGLMNENSV